MSIWKDKKTGRYRVKFMFQGVFHEKRGLKTKDRAIRWEAAEREKLENPPPPKPRTVPSESIDSLIIKYLEHCQPRMAENTVRAKAFYYSIFLANISDKGMPADEITRYQVSEYVRQIQAGEIKIEEKETKRKRDLKKTANRHLKDLSALFRWGVDNDLIRSNPARAIDPFPENPFIKYVPPAEDIDKVLLAANRQEMEILLTLYHTAGRIDEIRRLIWEDVNFEKKWIRLWTRKRKRGVLQEDLIPMTDILLDTLKKRWNTRDKSSPFVFVNPNTGKPYTKNTHTTRYLMERLCKRASVKPFGFHAIRHHVASIINDSGKATLSQIQKWLRHRRPSTTEKYLHEVGRSLREVAQILDFKKPNTNSGTTEEGESGQ